MVPKTTLTPASGHKAGPGTEASSQKVTFRNKNYVAGCLAVLVGSVLVMALDGTRKRIVRTSVACLFIFAILAPLHFVPWTSRKPFLRDIGRVQVGMTQTEVERIMAGYIRGTGWPADPFGDGRGAESLTEVSTGASYQVEPAPNGELAIRHSIVFRHSDDGRFNSDWGVVTFRDDKVVSVQFMPD